MCSKPFYPGLPAFINLPGDPFARYPRRSGHMEVKPKSLFLPRAAPALDTTVHPGSESSSSSRLALGLDRTTSCRVRAAQHFGFRAQSPPSTPFAFSVLRLNHTRPAEGSHGPIQLLKVLEDKTHRYIPSNDPRTIQVSTWRHHHRVIDHLTSIYREGRRVL